jgi:Holliday junction resolvase RusA-like endonuclease
VRAPINPFNTGLVVGSPLGNSNETPDPSQSTHGRRLAQTPRPQGSKRAFRNKHTGRIQQVESSPDVAAWRDTIALAADIAMAGRAPLEGPVRLTVEFRFQRPASHRGVKGLRPSAPAVHHQRPDASKLVRALEDALTTIAWRDDSQVAQLLATKVWDDVAPAGATVNVEVLT